MKNKMKKAILFITSVCLFITMLAGCNTPSKVVSTKSYGDTYPIQATNTLTVWMQFNPTSEYTNFEQVPLAKELEKKTGIKVKYQHPPANQVQEQFTLMCASGEMPDVVVYGWLGYSGGSQKAIDDKIILPLNDIIEKYSPNLKNIISNDKDLDRMLKTDSNQYYAYPMIRGGELSKVYYGPMVRADWLKQLNMQPPETIAEWDTMLRAFKGKFNAKYPLAIMSLSVKNTFVSAYKTSDGYYVNDSGKVVYGPSEESYKQFLQLLNGWYKDGLLDTDFSILDSKTLNANMLNGKAGATVGLLGGSLGNWLDTAKGINPDFDLVGTKYPVLNKGDKPFMGQKDFTYFPSYAGAITTKCKDVELAARWLDYSYSKEGQLVNNFGILGESYTLDANQKPQWTDLVLNNPNGKTTPAMWQLYNRANGPFVQNQDAYIFKYPQQRQAAENWTYTDTLKHTLPPFITLDVKKTNEISKINTSINTYQMEMATKFVMGIEPLSNFDKYVAELKNRGMDKAIQLNQEALDIYNNR